MVGAKMSKKNTKNLKSSNWIKRHTTVSILPVVRGRLSIARTFTVSRAGTVVSHAQAILSVTNRLEFLSVLKNIAYR